MSSERLKSGSEGKRVLFIRRFYNLLAPRAYSVIVLGALICTLAVKFFHAWRIGLVNEYFSWILTDIAVLLGIEVILALVCFHWPHKWVLRIAFIAAAVVCTWSVMNAGWLIRTGTQILPAVLLPLFRSPLNALGIIGVNLVKMPATAVILLGPSAIALTFFFLVLAKPIPPAYNRKLFTDRILASLVLVLVAVLAGGAVAGRRSPQIASEGLRYNCQLRAVTTFIFSQSSRKDKADLAVATRKIPAFDQIQIAITRKPQQTDHNIVLVVLEGIQYSYTSLADKQSNLTPHLAALAEQGVEFVGARSSLTHTTKVLFSLLTGRFPSVSQDIAEAVPAVKPYAGIATILKQKLNFRTAFFQSAKGNFECRPGLVHNLGFDKFWAREDSNDPKAFLGYLACDEFKMLKPITDWIKACPVRDTNETLSNSGQEKLSNGADQTPFFLAIMCSVSHDPYVVPDWFDTPAKEPLERYKQTISYTDSFLAALDTELEKMNLTEKTIFCVIGDHGEAFGEHGLLGHERIAFEEVLQIPFCLRAPALVQPKTKITQPVSSIDLTPTLLAMLGFNTSMADFDGLNALAPIPNDRKVFFSGWLGQSPAGFVKENRKFIYNTAHKIVSVYDLNTDPQELSSIELPHQNAQPVADEIIAWRKNTIFRLQQKQTGEMTLFDSWLCRWNNRIASAKYRPDARD